MEEGDNWGNRLTHASMETTDVKPLIYIVVNRLIDGWIPNYTVYNFSNNGLASVLLS